MLLDDEPAGHAAGIPRVVTHPHLKAGRPGRADVRLEVSPGIVGPEVAVRLHEQHHAADARLGHPGHGQGRAVMRAVLDEAKLGGRARKRGHDFRPLRGGRTRRGLDRRAYRPSAGHSQEQPSSDVDPLADQRRPLIFAFMAQRSPELLRIEFKRPAQKLSIERTRVKALAIFLPRLECFSSPAVAYRRNHVA